MRALTELKKECFNRVSDNWIYCIVCDEERIKKLVLHHLSYTKNSVIYNQFENSDDGRLQYHSKLLDEIKKNKNNFVILCMNCHKIVESLIDKEIYEIQNVLHDHRDGYRLECVIMCTKEKQCVK